MLAAMPEIVEIEPETALVMSGEVPFAELVDFFTAAFTATAEAAVDAGVELAGPPVGYYPTTPTDIVTIEAGFPVSGPVESTEEVHPLVLPAGRAVVAMHVGPYDTLGETYEAVMAWMREHGLQPVGPMWECYVTDPGENPDPATWETKIVWPIT
jgi:effector-binding domain-containing protein